MSTPSDLLLDGARELAGVLPAGEADAARRRVPGSAWMVEDVVSHVVFGLETYLSAMTDDPEVFARLVPGDDLHEGIRAMSARELATCRMPVSEAARRIEELAGRCVVAATATDASPVSWYGGALLAPEDVLGMLGTEAWVHGHDLARGLRRPWVIPADHAATALSTVRRIAPLFVVPEAAGGFDGHVRVWLSERHSIDFAFEDGRLLDTAPAGRPGCSLHTDPETYLLLAYGRLSPFSPRVLRRCRVRGARPWWALRLSRALSAP